MAFLDYLKQNMKDGDGAYSKILPPNSKILPPNSEDAAAKTDDKLNDKLFMRNVGISIFAILMCIVMLTASTFAWFSTTIESSETITSSVFKLDISLSPDAAQSPDGDSVTLLGGTKYTVRIHAITEGTTGNTGYIKLQIGDEIYISEQVYRGGDDLVFELEFSTNTTVKIIECWGLSSVSDSDRDINSGDILVDMQSSDFNKN